jgi:hypothetical protein
MAASESAYAAASSTSDDRSTLLAPNEPRGSDSSERSGSTIFPGREQREQDLVFALPRAMLLATFICIYSGCSLRILNDADHLPRFWINHPSTMESLGRFLIGGGIVIAFLLVVLVATSRDMRPECTCDEVRESLKPSRLAGYLWHVWVTACLLSLPYLTFLFYEVKQFRPQDTAWFVAAVFALLTVVYSLREIIKHLQNFTLPQLQTNICRILLMPPVYAVASFLQLRLLQQGVYISCVRELYEAFTVYSFMHLMTDFLIERAKVGGIKTNGIPDVVALLNGPDGELTGSDGKIHHKFPMSLLEKAGCIKPWDMQSVDGQENPISPFYANCRLGVLQYVPVAIFGAAMATLLELVGMYHEAKISLTSGWFYLCLLRNISQFVALYSLVMFYHGSKKLLADLRPLPKFLSIKLVIFFTFWQKLVLIGLKKYDLLPIHALYETQYESGALNTTAHGPGISTWGDDISTPELFSELASAGIQNL